MVQWGPSNNVQDGYEFGGPTWVNNPNPIYAGSDSYQAAFRFTVSDPDAPDSGDTIDASTEIVIDIDGVTGTPDGLTLFGNAVDDAPVIDAVGNEPSAWTFTAAGGTIPASPGTGTETIDAQTPVQDIVSRGGWVAGQDMAFVIWDDGTNSNTGEFLSIDGATTVATLEINWTAAGAGGSILPHIMAYS